MSLTIHRLQSLPYPVKIVLLTGAYFALGRVGLLFSVVHSSVSMVWPSTGFALAAILLFGYRLWPGVALGAFLVNISNDVPVPAAAMMSVGNTLESIIGAYLLLRFAHFNKSFERTADVIWFVAMAVVASPVISATLGVTALYVNNLVILNRFATVWWVWWVGDAMGALIITPFLLTWGMNDRVRWKERQTLEVILLFVMTGVVSALVFATPLATAGFVPLAYLTFPFVAWAAFRCGARGAASGSLLIWIIAAWGTTGRTGPFIRANEQESLIFAWSYIAPMSITSLLLAAAVGERKRSASSLNESQARLQAIVENLPYEIWARDLDGRCVMQNPASVALWGDILGKGLEDLGLPPDILAKWEALNQRTLAGEVIRGENEVDVQGVKRTYYYIASPIRDGNTIHGILGTNIDVTEQKQAELALRESEARFRAIFERSSVGIIVVDREGRSVSVNSAFEQMIGYTEAELRQIPFSQITHPADLADNLHYFERLQQGEINHYQMDKRYLRKDGKSLWTRINVSPVTDSSNPNMVSVALVEDISDQKKAETALRASEARLRAIFEASSIGIVMFGSDGYPLSTNPALQRMLGYSDAELCQMRFRSITHPDDVQETIDMFERLRQGEFDHYNIDKRYIRKDGEIVWAQITVSGLENSGDHGVVAVTLVEDITNRKLAEAALRESEARFRAILEGTSIGIVMVDRSGFTLSANPAFVRMVGYSETELKQMRFRDYTHPDDVPDNLGLFQRLVAGELNHYQYDKRYIRKDGGIVWVRMNVSGFPYRQENMVVALIEDITEQKRAEAALRESEAHNTALLNAVPDLMFLLDKNGIFLDYRAPDVSHLFIPPEAFLGKSVYEVLPASMTAQLQDTINRAIETGQMQLYEYASPREGDLRIFESRLVTFGDDKILVMSRDITERKRTEAEIQALNADLEQRVSERTAELAAANERLTELDRLKSKFIADVSHELRTPLAVLNTRVYLLEKGLPEKRAEYLIGLREQIERLTQFVNTTLDLSRLELGKGKVEFTPVNLNEVVEQVTAALAPRAESNGLRLNIHYADNLPPVRGEFNQLAQVTTNLTANAINYTANGRIEVSTGFEKQRVWLRVKDTGMGIAQDDIPHLFERFYRGERAGQSQISGSGLGLSIVKEIVDLHSGDIQVESDVSAGSIFTVWLPVWNGTGQPEPESGDDALETQDQPHTNFW